jgi:hypothetical protein
MPDDFWPNFRMNLVFMLPNFLCVPWILDAAGFWLGLLLSVCVAVGWGLMVFVVVVWLKRRRQARQADSVLDGGP